ncbi:MAG: UDP-N-acetylmuramoyl-tripeptide--D-alanyl-D-alanine ligase [Alphaproteobacteria bacterium]|nr:UDP-N-acetylmuramoyl-tripeptide--D-alanyl-D-alanine ligase [Alphaproteobacteria bacterium]
MTGPATWTAAAAASACGGIAHGDWTAAGISIDSRSLSGGELFVALSGPNFDGHDYLAQALNAGAAAAVVSRLPEDHAGAPLLVVDDTEAALVALARAGRARSAARLVGITGSVGKTGTKDLAARALSTFGATHASRGNLNNQIGLPLSLANLPPEAQFCVLEMGMNHAGEIAHLSRIARPDVALVTTVEAVHLAHFRDVGEIAAAKAEIFSGMAPGGTAVLNRDNPHFSTLVQAAGAARISRIVDFGSSEACTARLLDYRPAPGNNRVSIAVDGRCFDYVLGIDGRHWALNSLAALAAVHALGEDVGRAATAFAEASPPTGRGAMQSLDLACGRVFVIDDSYNASPASMRAAIAMLAETGASGRRVAVLGDMLELGPDAESLHAALALDLERVEIDLVHCAGPLSAATHHALAGHRRGLHAQDATELATQIAATLRDGDVVLVKGSRGSAMEQVVAALAAAEDEGGTMPLAANGDA